MSLTPNTAAAYLLTLCIIQNVTMQCSSASLKFNCSISIGRSEGTLAALKPQFGAPFGPVLAVMEGNYTEGALSKLFLTTPVAVESSYRAKLRRLLFFHGGIEQRPKQIIC